MSWKAIDQIWTVKLPPGLKFTLIAYARHADQKGGAIFPSVPTIMDKTGYSRRQVQYNTKKLVDDGWLVKDGKGPKGTNRYRLGGAIIAPSGVQQLHGGGAISDAQGVQPIAPDPIPNPSLNHINTWVQFFRGLTGFDPPNESTDQFKDKWQRPIEAIIGQSKDHAEIEERITYAVMTLRKKNYTIASPNSIRVAALNWNGQRADAPDGDEEFERVMALAKQERLSELPAGPIREAVTAIGSSRFKDAKDTQRTKLQRDFKEVLNAKLAPA